MSRTRVFRPWCVIGAAGAWLMGVVSCAGDIGGAPGGSAEGAERGGGAGSGMAFGSPGAGSAGAGGAGAGPAGAASGSASCPSVREAPVPRIQRLTNAQYLNTVRDLLLLDAPVSQELVADPTDTGFDTHAERLQATDQHVRRYQTAAEALAAQVVANPKILARHLACMPAPDPAACARRFVTDFGRRAFRRPLAADEIQAFVALHGRAGALYPSGGDPFTNGVALVIQAMLQAPEFLYRSEAGDDPDGDGVAPLSDWEMASRLSYALLGSMPDEPLFAAAAAGKLRMPAEVKEQARRLLGDPRARELVASFHRQWFGTEAYADLTRDTKRFPAFTPGMGVDARRELERFVDHVIFERGEGLRTLLLANYTFTNRSLARVYGLGGTFTNDLVRVDLEAGRRAGLLTQVGFLLAYAHFDSTDPVNRGVFVHRRILCTQIPSPPDNVDQKLPAFSASVRTTRERVEALTAPAPCNTCHNIINPAGFAFENYDAIGAYRDNERGFPINASGAVPVGDKTLRFEGALDFIRQLSESDAVRQCYAGHWLRFVYGRLDGDADRCALDRLTAALANPAFAVKDLLVELTQTRAFLTHIVRR